MWVGGWVGVCWGGWVGVSDMRMDWCRSCRLAVEQVGDLRFWLYYKCLFQRVNHLTQSRWPNEYYQTVTTMNLIFWIWSKLKLINLMKPTNLNFTSGVLLTSMPDVFFLLEKRSEAGKVSQPVRACEPGLGYLSKPTAPAYFWGVKFFYFFLFFYFLFFNVIDFWWSYITIFLCYRYIIYIDGSRAVYRVSLSCGTKLSKWVRHIDDV